jgi:hypothetical protein
MAKERSTLWHKEKLNVKRNKRKEHKVHFMSRHQEGSQNRNKNLLKGSSKWEGFKYLLSNTPAPAPGLCQPLIE